MSKKDALIKVKKDIADKDLGMARQRLHSLIAEYPNDLSLRSKLAKVYWKLQYPELAGRYWYLEENLGKEGKLAVGFFKKMYGNDEFSILRALKFKGSLKSIPLYARHKLERLQRILWERNKIKIVFKEKNKRKGHSDMVCENCNKGCGVWLIIVVVVLVSFIIFAFIGFIISSSWLLEKLFGWVY